MSQKKVSITESSMRGYNGHLFMTEFKNGTTVAPVSERTQSKILACVRSNVVEDKPPVKKPEPPAKEPDAPNEPI
ncbi:MULTISPECIES: hypothetical protein [Providencia]|uniref:hypothetical protein n=1 Tax=Providencia TaxID=586 RepID=UPI00234A07EB|nr:hypothetical protein [Providencia sp. PROV145]